MYFILYLTSHFGRWYRSRHLMHIEFYAECVGGDYFWRKLRRDGDISWIYLTVGNVTLFLSVLIYTAQLQVALQGSINLSKDLFFRWEELSACSSSCSMAQLPGCLATWNVSKIKSYPNYGTNVACFSCTYFTIFLNIFRLSETFSPGLYWYIYIYIYK